MHARPCFQRGGLYKTPVPLDLFHEIVAKA
jgi:hypothetical protein